MIHNRINLKLMFCISVLLMFLVILNIYRNRFDDPIKTVTYSWYYCNDGGLWYTTNELRNHTTFNEYKRILKCLMLNLSDKELVRILCADKCINHDIELQKLRKYILDFYNGLDGNFEWYNYQSNTKYQGGKPNRFFNNNYW